MNINPDFPFFGSISGFASPDLPLVGWLIGLMSFSPHAGWFFALFVTVFHVPRTTTKKKNIKQKKHNWVYLAVFADALIWHRLIRERRWSFVTEAWRLVALIGVFWSTGYHWGPMIIQWLVVRCFVGAYLLWSRFRKAEPIRVEGVYRPLLWPALCAAYLIIVDVRWFSALYQEVKGIGGVFQAGISPIFAGFSTALA